MRPMAARAPAAALLLLAASGAACAQDEPCGAVLDARQRVAVEGPQHHLAFVPVPAPLASGRHFSLEIVVCARAGARAPSGLKVDADMPSHRHGMNYKATVTALGNGRYRADGLMLHMAGRWRLLFDLTVDGRTQRLVHEQDLP